MIGAAIVCCEIGFWLLLGFGLLLRYRWNRPCMASAVLCGLPVLDLALLVLTLLVLRAGARPDWTHGLAAVYLGFSIVFGPPLIRWADQRVRSPTAQPDARRPNGPPHVRTEWRRFGRACVAAATSIGLLLGAVAWLGDSTGTGALLAWIPQLGLVLAGWLILGPLWVTARQSRLRPRSGRIPGKDDRLGRKLDGDPGHGNGSH
jgi:hypothetical protein